MAKKFQPKIVTANDLLGGEVVYFTPNGEWSGNFNEALVATNADMADEVLAAANLHTHKIVGAYVTNARINEYGLPEPDHYREIFRSRGPSNYFHGKQAQV